MKKLLALALIALVLLSLPLPSVRADGEAPKATPAPSDAGENGAQSHNIPSWESSLAYWEQVEWPSLPLTGSLREDVLTIARSQLGYCSDPSCYEETGSGDIRYYTRFGEWDGAVFDNWCDSFVSFCVHYAGNTSYPKESSCGRHMFYLKAAGYWREWNCYMPRPGDLVFFKFSRSSLAPSHVGLVEKVVWGEGTEGGKLVTIEGNLSDPERGVSCVRRVTRSLDQVVGYGTFEKGTAYPSEYTVRSYGEEIIGEDSCYFIEQPEEEVLRFLGLYGTPYYSFWFPEEEEEDTLAEPTEEPVIEDGQKDNGKGNS